jgi:hypothetical protein
MNIFKINSNEIYDWDNKKICTFLIEAKKIEKTVEKMKDILRNRLTQNITIKTSNGKVKLGKSSMTFTYKEKIVNDKYLMSPIRPLNKKRVRSQLIKSGKLPEGVKIKYSKKSITLIPN